MADGVLEKFRQWFKIMRHYGGIKNTVLALYRQEIHLDLKIQLNSFIISYDDLKVGKFIGADKYGNRYYQNTRYFVGRIRSFAF